VTPPTVQFIPASGPTLLIHDSFQSSGSSGSAWDTRVPDVQTVGSNSWYIPKSATSLTFAYDSSLFCGYRTAYSSTINNSQFKDTIAISTGQSYQRIVCKIKTTALSLSGHGVGVSFWDSSGTTAGSENFGCVFLGFTNYLIIRELNAGTENTLTFSQATTFVPSTDYVLDVLVGASTVTADLYDGSGTSLLDTISTSTGSFSIPKTANAGCMFLGFGSGSSYSRVLDFKVYA
jgi:hypothetical protein